MNEQKVDLSNNNSSKDRIKQMILANYNESYGYLKSSQYQSDWQLWNDQYRAIPASKPYSWMSNKFIPITPSKVDTALANIVGIMFQEKPPVEVKPKPFGKGDELHAGIIRSLLAKQIDNEDFFYKFMLYIKGLLIYGTSVGKIAWNNTIKVVRIKQKQVNDVLGYFQQKVKSIFMGYQEQKESIEIEDGPTFEVCNIGDIFPDPQAVEINDSWVIYRCKRSIGYLQSRMKSKSPNGIYNEEVLQIKKSDSNESKDGKYEIESNTLRQMNVPVSRTDLNTLVELLEWHGYDDVNNDGILERCIYVLVAGRYLIRGGDGEGETPFWHNSNPFIKGVYIPLINEFYGVGIPELLCDMQDNINENVNQRNDCVELVLNPEKVYKKNTGIKTKTLISAPGRIHGADEVGDLRWERPPDISASIFPHVRDYERWAEEVSAVAKITMSVAGAGTATESGLLQQNASTRFSIIAKIIEYTSFSKVLKMFYELDYQFYDEYKIAAIVGCDPAIIDMDKMRPDYYDYVPAGVRTMEDKNQKALKLLQFMNIAKDDPSFKMEEALKKFYSLLSIGDNPNELIRTPEETAQVMAMRKQQELMQMVLEAKLKAQSSGKGNEGTQFKAGEVNQSTPGVPPATAPSAPDQNLGATPPSTGI